MILLFWRRRQYTYKVADDLPPLATADTTPTATASGGGTTNTTAAGLHSALGGTVGGADAMMGETGLAVTAADSQMEDR